MTDQSQDTPAFETDEVQANRAIENGQGVGARELAAQREPGGVVTENEDPEMEDGVSIAEAESQD